MENPVPSTSALKNKPRQSEAMAVTRLRCRRLVCAPDAAAEWRGAGVVVERRQNLINLLAVIAATENPAAT
ncbi:MAG: hypothetical protein ACLU3I_22415, partial [Acutalibacteraceae bacterium]